MKTIIDCCSKWDRPFKKRKTACVTRTATGFTLRVDHHGRVECVTSEGAFVLPQLSTPETHGETGSVHPKRSQKAMLEC